MPAIKDMTKITAKWIRGAQGATQEYAEGVANPRKDWAQETGKATEAYKAGIQKSITADSFKKGVARAGTAKWQKGAIEKGVDRWAAGVAVSDDAYTQGFSPYHAVIARITLPPRGPKGDPKNILRVGAIAKALHDEKVGRS